MRRSLHFLALLVALTLAFAPPAAQAQIYVDADASGANDGSSWASAYTSLQDALGQATGSDEIWIAEGTYTPGASRSASFTITGAQDGVEIYGGFAPDAGDDTFAERDWRFNETVLSGGNSYHVLYIDGVSSGSVTTGTRIDGLTIAGGNADGDYGSSDDNGGGLYCDGSGSGSVCSPTLRNMIFRDNRSDGDGGAIYNYAENGGIASPVITGTVFVGNSTSGDGGAVYNDATKEEFDDTIPGATSSPTISSSLFVNNRAGDSGGAISTFANRDGESDVTLTNVTFTGNSAGLDGGALASSEAAGTTNLIITNTILHGNSAARDGDQISNFRSSATIDYSVVEGGAGAIDEYETSTDYDATNIEVAPQFAASGNPDGDDGVFATADDGLRLTPTSPAIDAGDDDAIDAGEDLTGAARIQGDTVDLGAYESVDFAPVVDAFGPTAVRPGEQLTITGQFFTDRVGITVNSVSIGTKTTSYTVRSPTQITATVPQDATEGPVTVKTSNDTGVSSADLNIIAPPYGSGDALTFSGGGDYVNAGDGIDLAGRSFSVSFWAKRASSGDDDYIVSQGTGGSDNRALHVGFRGRDEFTFAFYGNDLNVDAAYTDTRWHHWAATYDASTGDRVIYRDGVEVAGDQATGDYVGTGPLRIGTAPFGERSDDFNGQVDEVRIWSTARTRAEIRQSMHRTLSSSTSGLAAYYRFDEGSGQVAYDYAGPHSGSFAGDPTWTKSSAAFGQRSTLAAAPGPTSLDDLTADLTTGGDDDNYLTLYAFGAKDDPTVTGDDLPEGIVKRSGFVWGVEETGSVTADLTISYADVAGVDPARARLLKRDDATAGWQDVTNAFTWNSGAQTFTAEDVTAFSEFTVGEGTSSFTNFAPTAGAPGTEVTITGSNLTRATSVRIGGAAATDVTAAASGDTITATVPEGASDGPVEVTVGSQTITSSTDFHLAAPPYGSGDALALDGDGDYLSFPAGGVPDKKGTIEHWVYYDGSDGILLYTSDSHGSNGLTGTTGIELHTGISGGNFGIWYDDGPVVGSTSSSELQTGRWYHLAVTYDLTTGSGPNVKLYVNGQLDAEESYAGTPTSDTDAPAFTYLGRPGTSTRYFGGKVDEVRAWSDVRTQTQIQASMNATLSGSEQSLAAYYRFGEGSGPDAYDYAGSFSGTLEGDPAWTTSGASLGQRSVAADASGETTLGESDARVAATLASADDSNFLTLYDYGSTDGSDVTDESFPETIERRARRVWGVQETGDVTADLTISYAGVIDAPPMRMRLLERDGPDADWQDVTDDFTHDTGARTFTATGLTDFSEFAVAQVSGLRLRVDPDASGDRHGRSWADAYTSLQSALDVADGRDEIWIAEGTYTPGENRDDSFTITGGQNGLELYGGFSGDEQSREERDPSAQTILSGDIDGDGTLSGNSYHVLYLDGYNGGKITGVTRIDGVTVTGGNADGSYRSERGGGLFCNGGNSGRECSPTITNAVFTGNNAGYGGAIYNKGSSSGRSNPTITNTVFTGNSAGERGGAIYNNGNNGGTSNPQITNATFSGNSSDGDGGAIYSFAGGSPAITNSIFWNNSASGSGDEVFVYSSTTTISHTLVEGGCPSGASCSDLVTGNPLFAAVDDAAGDDDAFATADDGLRLVSGSPAINAGDDDAISLSEDLAGAGRVQDGNVDLGAYEGAVTGADVALAMSADPLNATRGDAVTFTLDLSSIGSLDATGVEVNASLPAGLSFVSAAGDGSYDDQSGTWTVGALATGAEATLEITTTYQASDAVTFAAQVAAVGPVNANPFNDEAAASVTPPFPAAYGPGDALALDGDDDYVSFPAEVASSDAGTFAHWVYVDENASGSGILLYASNGTSSSYNGFTGVSGIEVHTAVNGDGKLAFAYDDGDASASVTGTTTLQSGRWYHLAATYDATGSGDGDSDVKLYVNGQLDGSGTISGTPGGHDPTLVRLGRPGSDTRYFDGQVDEVRIWETARTRAEIRQSMHRTLSSNASGLAAYYRFDEDDDETVYDYAGLHLGTLEGDPQRAASGAVLGQRSTLADAPGPTSLDAFTADLTTGGDADDYLRLYAYGANDSSAVTAEGSGESFPTGISKRSHLVRGAVETGDVTADLTISYAGIAGLNLDKARLLKRARPAADWQAATDGATHDAGAQTFTVPAETDFSEFAIGEATLGIAGFAPTTGFPGIEVTITGTQFSGVDGVSIGGVSVGANNFSVDAPTQITATVPQGAADGPVTVTKGGKTVTAGSDFLLFAPSYGPGDALAFDGDDDYVNAGDGINLAGSSFTISFWARRGSPDANGYIVGQGNSYDKNQALEVGFLYDDEFKIGFEDNDLRLSGLDSDTDWHHWAATYDADTGRRVIYRDGVQVAADQSSGDYEGTGTLYLGTSSNPYWDFEGRIDEVRIWKIARTEGAIRASMHETLSGDETGLAAYYRFDEDDDATVYDFTGVHDGTLGGDAAREKSGAALGRQSTFVDPAAETALGAAGAQVRAALPGQPDADSLLTLYAYGSKDSSAVTGKSVRLDLRAHRVWGVAAAGNGNASVSADLTFSYGALAGVASLDSAQARLFKREGADAYWQDVTADFTHDAEAQTFTASAVTSFSEFAVGTTPPGGTVYVDADASGAGDGSSWDDAYPSLKAALDASSGKATLWVAEGAYTPGPDRGDSFTITGAQDGLKLYGGFAGGETSISERAPTTHETILSGDVGAPGDSTDNSYHVLHLDGTAGGPITASTVIDGVTVTGGNADGDRGSSNASGGGLYCNGAGSGNACSPTLANVAFTENSAETYGAAAYHQGEEGGVSSPTLTDVVFADNSSAFLGGALVNDGYDGGVSSPTFTNVVFADNSASLGGAIYNYGSGGENRPVITGATFAGNGAVRDGGAIYNTGETNAVITNAIFYGNRADTDGDGSGSGNDISNARGGEATLRHTLIAGGCPADSDCGDGSTIINADPLFADAAAPAGADSIFATADDGLRLAAGSPALDAGANDSVSVSTDLRGAQRIQGGTVDLGPYEGAVPTVDLALSMSADTTTAAQGDVVTFTLALANVGSLDATGIEVSAALPSDFSYQSDTGGGSYDDQSGVWSVGALASGDDDALQITATFQASEYVTFAAQLAASDQIDANSANDEAVVAVTPPAPASYGPGRALALDGSGDYVNAGSGIDLANRSFSISFWAKRAASGDDDYIVSLGSGKGDNQALHVGFRSRDEFTFAFYANDLNVDASYTDTRWHHWAAVYDASTGDRAVYRDGVEVASETSAGAFQGSGPLRIGTAPFDERSDDFEGRVDEVRVWQTARTQQQIRQTMHRTLSGSETGLAAYWRFDGEDGSAIYDYVGPHGGTLEGDPQRVNSGAPLGQRSALAATTGATTLGASGAQISATPDAADANNYLTLYDYGSKDSSAVTGEAFPTDITNRAARVWGVEKTGSVTTDLTFSYGGLAGLSLANVRLLKRDGPSASWQDVTDQFTWDEGAQRFTASDISDFSQFAVAEATTPLSVELTSFEANADGPDAVRLSWQTASETGNARFEIQRQTDVETFRRNVSTDRRNVSTTDDGWTTVGTRKGAGTTAEAQRYAFTDEALPFTADTVRYRLRQIDTGGAEALSDPVTVAVSTPQAFALHGSFPNPFRQVTTIRYELPQSAGVRLEVYDALGRRVRVLVDREQQAGRKAIRFEASSLSAGVYFYRITAGDYTETRKLVRVR